LGGQVNAIKRHDSAVSQLSWLRHPSVHHITCLDNLSVLVTWYSVTWSSVTCLDNLCFPYADDSAATTPTSSVTVPRDAVPRDCTTTPTIDVIFGTAPFYSAAVRRSSSRSRQATSTQLLLPATTARPGFTFARNRREPTHFQWHDAQSTMLGVVWTAGVMPSPHFQWYAGVTQCNKLASQHLQLPHSALTRHVSPRHS